MTYVLGVNISDSIKKLLCYYLDLFFLKVLEFKEIGAVIIIHNEKAYFIFKIQVHISIFDDVGMLESIDFLKITLEKQNLLLVHFHRFNST